MTSYADREGRDRLPSSRQTLRVALVYRSFGLFGSLSRRTVELARHLSARHDVHVYSIGARTDTSLAPECTFHDVAVVHQGDGTRFSGAELLSFAFRAARQVGRESFDVVHVCNPSTWVGDVLHLPGVARGESMLQGVSRKRFAASRMRPGNAARWVIEHRAVTRPSLRRIHVDAPSVVGDLERYYGISEERVLVVPPAVNLDEFRPADDKAKARASVSIHDPGRTVLLFCGSDFQRKGLDRAIEALAATHLDAELLVVGAHREEARFQALARALGVGERVRFFGSRTDTARFFQAADVLLLPTRADVWGVTPIEAMACGIPSIVTAAAGSATVVQEAGAGIVLGKSFDKGDLRAAIEQLAGNPGVRQEMGRNGLAAVGAHSWERRTALVESDLIDVAAARARPTRR